MPRIRALLVFTLGILLLTAAVAGNDTYNITLDQSVDIPERTLETDSREFTVSTIGRYAEDDTLEATTSGPENVSYSIRLIDSKERLLESKYRTGDSSANFSLNRRSPGTYAVVITNESDAEDVKTAQPFVVYGYTVTHTTPTEIEEDSTLEVDFRLERVDGEVDEPPAGVELALGNDSTSIKFDAERTSELNYTAEIDISSLSPGDYSLYTGVQRDNTVYGYQELIGVDEYSVSVTESTASTDTPASSPSTTTETELSGGQSTPPETTTEASEGTAVVTETSTPKTPSTATTESSLTFTSSSAPSTDGSDTSSDEQTANERLASASTVMAGDTSTPVSTPLIPNGSALVVCLGSLLLLHRVLTTK